MKEYNMITVYWSPAIEENCNISSLNFDAPVNLIDWFKKNSGFDHNGNINENTNFNACPAFTNLFKNTYGLKFPYDYELYYANKSLTSSLYDQKFFDGMIAPRSEDWSQFDILANYLFISEDPLEMILQPSYMHDNDFNRSFTLVSGQFDIGRWHRPIVGSVILKDKENPYLMKKDDIYCYVKFLTNDNIKLQKFYLTPTIDSIINDLMSSRKNKGSKKNLRYYYDLFAKSNLHKKMISEIKNNLL